MFDEQTYDIIRQRVLERINVPIDKREGSFVSNNISPAIEEIAKAYIDMGDIPNLVFIQDGFNEFLDKRLSDFGVYRKQGTKATGEITVVGKQGSVISNGTILVGNELNFTVLNDIVLSDIDNKIFVEALEVGKKYNLLANTEFNLVEFDSNITSLKNELDFKNGVDVESDEDLKKRFDKVNTNTPTSGNKAHFEQWALEVDGVGNATVYPLWNGNGTVKVTITDNDNKPVSEEIISNTKAHIDEVRPIWGELTVNTPTLLNIVIVASVKLEEGYIKEDIKEAMEEALSVYIKDIDNKVVYSKVYGILANQIGVNDVASLTINGANSSVDIPADKIANISSIEVSEVI